MLGIVKSFGRASRATYSALGGSDRKDEKNKATGDYYRALDAVREAAQGKEMADA